MLFRSMAKELGFELEEPLPEREEPGEAPESEPDFEEEEDEMGEEDGLEVEEDGDEVYEGDEDETDPFAGNGDGDEAYGVDGSEFVEEDPAGGEDPLAEHEDEYARLEEEIN